MVCEVGAAPVGTGSYEQDGETLRLGAWSALAWTAARA